MSAEDGRRGELANEAHVLHMRAVRLSQDVCSQLDATAALPAERAATLLCELSILLNRSSKGGQG